MIENEHYLKLKHLIDNLPIDAATKIELKIAALDWVQTILTNVRTSINEIFHENQERE